MPAGQGAPLVYLVTWEGRHRWNHNQRGSISRHKSLQRAIDSAIRHRDRWHGFWPIPLLYWCWRVRDTRDGAVKFEIN